MKGCSIGQPFFIFKIILHWALCAEKTLDTMTSASSFERKMKVSNTSIGTAFAI